MSTAARLTMVAALLLAPWPVHSQVVVSGGPPPQIRTLLDAFMTGLNGDAQAFEAMANDRFSVALLAQRPASERRTMHQRIREDFGTLSLRGVMRQGPNAPLELQISGSKGVSGVIAIALDESGAVPRITTLSIEMGTGERDAAAPPINGAMPSDALGRALDAHVSALVAADAFAGVVLVARDHVPVFLRAYGAADRSRQIPNTPETRFNIGSINKTFTKLAIDQLVSAGKLAYTDTLGRLFPDYPQALSRGATVEQLVNHTAGLADFFGEAFSRASKDQFRSNDDYFRFVSAQPPAFAPGERNAYCNGCYIALGAIVARVSGQPYETYVAEHIFTPDGMLRTGFPHVDAIESDIAVGYTRQTPDGSLRSAVYMHGAAGSAAGGGYSTATDLLSYVRSRRQGPAPRDTGAMGVAGGAPGTNAVIESDGPWTVVVLSNVDPPSAEGLGVAIMRALTR